MIRSMTGFGEAEGATPGGRLRVELRTVNHRYLNVNARLPNVADPLGAGDPGVAARLLHARPRELHRAPGARGGRRRLRGLPAGRGAGGAPTWRSSSSSATASASPGAADLSLLARFNDIIVREEPEESEAEVSAEQLREVVIGAAAAGACGCGRRRGGACSGTWRSGSTPSRAALAEIERARARAAASPSATGCARRCAELLGGVAPDEDADRAGDRAPRRAAGTSTRSSSASARTSSSSATCSPPQTRGAGGQAARLPRPGDAPRGEHHRLQGQQRRRSPTGWSPSRTRSSGCASRWRTSSERGRAPAGERPSR